eukprot:CAMPEP_0113448790 /NCGR_PEP_ID=MMETSP0014_2-20120614/4951_1 /TAXON_ID=2857 /ORGANISM="Nitzschia sp." /LENGTH=396 /DNA_ID=CAMNT_0000340019 /DNA_START=55 /DNA_END=1245 /DNA_ORIENTATION=+ /assembly_acc=CAM_ASM_000159
MTNETEPTVMPWLTENPNVETGLRMLMTFIAIVGALWAVFPTVSYFVRVKRAAYVLSRVTLKYTRALPKHLLPRPTVMSSLLNALDDPDFNTVLVYGKRGSGKTTAIEKALGKRLGVLQWTLAADDGPTATAELKDKWSEVFRPWIKPEDREFDMNVCSAIATNCKKTLVVIISVESSAKPSALKIVLHFCKTMSYNTQLVRFIVDISSSRVAVALQTDLKKLRISPVLVGSVTQSEAHSLLGRKLPERWTEPKKQEVSLNITEKFDWILLNLIEVCKGIEEGMSADAALEHVRKTYDGEMMVATNRLESFDTLILNKLNDMPGKPSPPKLLQKNPEGLDQRGIMALKRLISFPAFASLVSEVGAPYIFEIDPFTETVSLNGRIMERAFIQHYEEE